MKTTSSLPDLLAFLIPSFDRPLSLIFALAIFSILFGALMAALRSKYRWPERESQLANDLKASLAAPNMQDIQEGLRGRDPWGEFALRTPPQLLVIGLLGTFVGVGLAIDEAGKGASGPEPTGVAASVTAEVEGQAVAPEDSHQALVDRYDRLQKQGAHVNRVLSSLGAKFQTSVWGISASLLCSLVASLLVETQRKASATRVFLDVRANLARRQAEKDGDRDDLFRRRMDRLHERLDEIAQGVSALPGAAAEMQEAAAGTSAAVQDFKENTTKAIEGMNDRMEQAADALRKSGEDVKSAAGGISAAVKHSLSEFQKGTAGVLDNAAKNIVASSNGVKNAIDGMKSELGESLRQLNQSTISMGTAAEGVTAAVGEVTGTVGDMTEEVGQMRRAVALLNDTQAQVKAALEAVEGVATRSAILTESLDNALHEDGILAGGVADLAAIRARYAPTETEGKAPIWLQESLGHLRDSRHSLVRISNNLAPTEAGKRSVAGGLEDLATIVSRLELCLGALETHAWLEKLDRLENLDKLEQLDRLEDLVGRFDQLTFHPSLVSTTPDLAEGK